MVRMVCYWHCFLSYVLCISGIGVNPEGWVRSRPPRFWDEMVMELYEILLYPIMYRNMK